MSSWRLQILLVGFFLLGLLVTLRLFYWQIMVGEKLKVLAETQYLSVQEIPAQRGQILAFDGFPLAINKQAFLVFAEPRQLKLESAELALKMAPILAPQETKETEEILKERLSRTDLFWLPLSRKIEREKKEEIEKLGLSGIGFQAEEKRFYPEGSMSAHLLGFVGQDVAGRDKGYFGLEGFYERTLSGKSGKRLQEQDPSGRPIPIGRSNDEDEFSGRDLVLYLRRGLQFMLEEKLKTGMEKYQAKEGLAVIMEPKTGAVLAMASFPNFNPADYAATDKNLYTNSVISQTFEPGSIFKPIIMAAAINEAAVKPEDRCLKCTGPRQIGEYTIRTWDDQYHPDSTMTEILEHSDNVGMVYVGEKLGGVKLIEYLHKFGFDQTTGIDLEGETVALFRKKSDWVPIDLATVAFGQGVAVTPIQVVRAIAAIANGGELVEPHVVAKVKTAAKEIEIKPKKQERVISQTTAKIITEMMVASAERGGKWERPKGYRIAGKTGTAQIPIAGHYDEEKTIVSFVGFAPADDPRFVMLVTLREPALIWGSRTVAPLWFEIAKEIFYHLGIPPNT